jgi:hypothetical protein
MGLKELCLASLHDLDRGKVGRQCDLLLAEARKDCVTRPTLKVARTVIIKLSLTPTSVDDLGNVEDVDCDVKLSSTLPSFAPATIHCSLQTTPSGKSQLLFNSESPGNARQGTLDEVVD